MEKHPGTDMARAYSSEVFVREDGRERRVLIEMNAPCATGATRFTNLPIFQTKRWLPDGPGSGQDYGHWFPYVSSLIMAFGLLIHLIRLYQWRCNGRSKKRNRARAGGGRSMKSFC